MPSVLDAIRDHAVNDATITALIGTRFFVGGRAERGATRPHCVLSRISSEPERHLGGLSGLARDQWQIDCIDGDPVDVEALADAVRLRFNTFGRGDMGDDNLDVRDAVIRYGPDGVGDVEGDSAGQYRQILELTLWRGEATS